MTKIKELLYLFLSSWWISNQRLQLASQATGQTGAWISWVTLIHLHHSTGASVILHCIITSFFLKLSSDNTLKTSSSIGRVSTEKNSDKSLSNQWPSYTTTRICSVSGRVKKIYSVTYNRCFFLRRLSVKHKDWFNVVLQEGECAEE